MRVNSSFKLLVLQAGSITRKFCRLDSFLHQVILGVFGHFNLFANHEVLVILLHFSSFKLQFTLVFGCTTLRFCHASLHECLRCRVKLLRALHLLQHLQSLPDYGRHAAESLGRILVHMLIGMVIGAMAALYDTTQVHHFLPLASALHQRVATLHQAFRQVVFAQVQIAAINAIFTGIFLAVLLPLAGIHLPFVKTMILITFLAGLLPVVGNLISNTVIVVIGLSHSLSTAMLALVFLVTIHKLEYFLNARIVGAQINARAWEILAAMLVMEALFGIPGVVAAPVYYAYLKSELSRAKLV